MAEIPESEWLVDEYGKRYRIVGNHMREYEMMIHTQGAEIPQSQLEEYHRRNREAEERRRQQEKEAAAHRKPTVFCPFRTGLSTACKEDCTFYTEDGCRLAAHKATQDTQGRRCVFSNKECDSTCAMYNHGCTLPPVPAV